MDMPWHFPENSDRHSLVPRHDVQLPPVPTQTARRGIGFDAGDRWTEW
jgi:hypothetical protein